jgi:SAM-dependent methyltransferase
MYLIRKFRNVMRSVLQYWGSPAAKKKLWDSEFASGHWDYIDNTPGDCVYSYIKKHGGNGDILDLGCGSGNTGNELDFEVYCSYTGIDVSDVAVQKATERSQKNGRSGKNRYFQSDIIAYVPDRSYHLILFRESIMYIPQGKIKAVLDKLATRLAPSGVFVVRMCDRDKYSGIAQIFRENYQIVDEYLPTDVKTTVIVFRPKTAGKSAG